MAALHRLPKELILQILRYLSPRTLEVVAHSHNHALTDLCLVLLQPVFKSRRAFKRLKKQFDLVVYEDLPQAMMDGLRSSSGREILALPPQVNLKQPPYPRNLDYLELSGDLHWLQPPCPSIAKHMARYNRGCGIHEAAVADLTASAKRVGVRLPDPFLKFIQDVDRRDYVVKTDASRLEMDRGGLRKVPKSMDGGVGGYIIAFLAGMQYRIHLYLEPGEDGGYGLLEERSGFCEFCDSDDERKADACPRKNRGVTQKDKEEARSHGLEMMSFNPCIDLALLGTDFEAWLATRYYEKWLWFVGMKKSLASPALNEYVRQNMVA
ncbi:unnamed protein product [Clonostachys byssicola]|uniref:F-box domain-containing protein n=1 Tax=Clonostachys byssicola TaxID=160290 RepID=A0A9N9TX28_9HYPO|nr:unnamed protein product [Clonostachys byssicola]